MRIGGIGNLPGMSSLKGIEPLYDKSAQGVTEAPEAGKTSFSDTVKSAVEQVNTLQGNADTLAQKLATGDVQDVHQVLLALDKASTAFGLTVQVRNKALEAYQEIERMQV